MKKFFEILLIILLLPFILISLIIYFIYLLIEKLIVRHTAYFKKNKLKIKEEYYVGILGDPVFKIKNLICKYNLEYEVIYFIEEEAYLVINKNNECVLVYIRMKNFYCKNNELYFQEDTDKGTTFKVDEYLEQIKIDDYSYDKCKLLVLMEYVSKEDYEIVLNQSNILLVKEVKKDLLENL